MSWHESFTQFAADTKAHTKASFVNGVFTQALENDIYNKTAITTLETKIGSIESNISDAYDATSTYAVGDLCIHDNKLYECNTAIATAEIWTAAHWTETTINSLIAAQTQQINVLSAKTTSTGTMLAGTGTVEKREVAGGCIQINIHVTFSSDCAQYTSFANILETPALNDTILMLTEAGTNLQYFCAVKSSGAIENQTAIPAGQYFGTCVINL